MLRSQRMTQKKSSKPALRNRSIKQRDFKSRKGASSRASTDFNTTTIINRVREPAEDDNDVSIVNLNESTMSDMMSVGNMSMAGVSDASGSKVKRVATETSDDGSMYSGNDVQIVRNNNDVS